MKKRLLVLLLAGLTLFTACQKKEESSAPAVVSAAVEEDYVVKIGQGVTVGLCSAPFFIAIEKGYYEEEGLKWDLVQVDTGQSNLMLTTGQIDVTNNLLATLIQPLANGLDVRIPLGLHTGCVKVLVRPDSPIRTPADLRGKKIGTTGMAASGTVITQRYLAELGIGVSADNLEVEWVIYQSADLPLALERGQVDAIAQGDPTAWIIESEGKGRVIINSATDDYLKDEQCCVIVAATNFIKNYPQTAAKFVRAIQKAAAYVQDNPEETARLMAEKRYVAGEPEVNAAILKTYSYRSSVSGARTAIGRNTLDLQRIGLVDQDVDPEALTRNIFIALDGVPDSLF
ncbi:MAG: ABC transporter substrate-binding protein [Treponema sp.]|jgi:NitT/TauT family transport system substrate-binding protein|nr:ABC transporter substrate-binding protein [Treponema sp.]